MRGTCSTQGRWNHRLCTDQAPCLSTGYETNVCHCICHCICHILVEVHSFCTNYYHFIFNAGARTYAYTQVQCILDYPNPQLKFEAENFCNLMEIRFRGENFRGLLTDVTCQFCGENFCNYLQCTKPRICEGFPLYSIGTP